MKALFALFAIALLVGCFRRSQPVERVLWAEQTESSKIAVVYSGLNERRGAVSIRWKDIYGDVTGNIILFWTREFPENPGFKAARYDSKNHIIYMTFLDKKNIVTFQLPLVYPGNGVIETATLSGVVVEKVDPKSGNQ